MPVLDGTYPNNVQTYCYLNPSFLSMRERVEAGSAESLRQLIVAKLDREWWKLAEDLVRRNVYLYSVLDAKLIEGVDSYVRIVVAMQIAPMKPQMLSLDEMEFYRQRNHDNLALIGSGYLRQSFLNIFNVIPPPRIESLGEGVARKLQEIYKLKEQIDSTNKFVVPTEMSQPKPKTNWKIIERGKTE